MKKEGTIENPYDIKNPVYQPELRYKWGKRHKEWGVGLAIYRIKNKDYYWITLRGDKDFIYQVDIKRVYKFVKRHPDSTDNPKGTDLLVFPVGEWGEGLKLYKRFSAKECEELKEEEKLKRFSMAVL